LFRPVETGTANIGLNAQNAKGKSSVDSQEFGVNTMDYRKLFRPVETGTANIGLNAQNAKGKSSVDSQEFGVNTMDYRLLTRDSKLPAGN